MNVEVINTGTELLLGEIVNTHGGYIGDALLEFGIRVSRQTVVPDGDAVGDALRQSATRSDIILATGGLGPTHDDITRECTAAWLQLELVRSSELALKLEQFFAKRGLSINDSILRQSMVPKGAVVIPNPNGTAPGLYFEADLAPGSPHVFLLPGPPRELYPMFHDWVIPKLKDIVGQSRLERSNFRITGIGESEIARHVNVRLEEIGGLEIGYCLGRGDVTVRCIGEKEKLALAAEVIRSSLGDFLVSEDGRHIEEVVVSRLIKAGKTVSCAESCTGGLIASTITDVPGASEVFTHGFVTYANEAKRDVLGVPMELIEEFGAVSHQVAESMVEGCLRVAGSDLAVACTGIAGPGGGSDEKPVGTVYLGVAERGGETQVVHRLFRSAGSSGGRERFKRLTVQAGLDLLRRRLLGIPID